MAYQNLQKLLESKADKFASGKIICYPLGDTNTQKVITYAELLHESQQRGHILRFRNDFQAGSVVLLHLSDQFSGIIWFWAVLYAGGIPAMSTPFSNNPSHRLLHIEHLSKILKNPLCITSESTLEHFSGQGFLRPITIESLERLDHVSFSDATTQAPFSKDTALLMLTSGSTGNAKAVCLSHGQILAAIAGKSSVLELPTNGSFLNWISLDHVASLVEIHLQALFVEVDQVHVHAADIIMDPIEFLHLINNHRVSRTFAPNFFLARLRSALENIANPQKWNFSYLRYLASGGEANVTETCAAVTNLMTKYGAPKRTIVTGFGMTETCAGAIFNTDCPAYDVENGLEFASVGQCMPGIEMRITSSTEYQRTLAAHEIGDLELRGPVVFKEYFNNASATEEAFTKDGWFRTGDQAFIDSSGHLNLMGRMKDIVIINGVKYNPEEIESAIETADIPGVTSSFTVCFSSLRSGSQTEEIFVVYLPTYAVNDTTAHLETSNTIIRIVMIQTGARPGVIPLDSAALQKSTLGKLSRTKIKQSFERGDYNTFEEANKERIALHRTLNHQKPANATEEGLLKIFCDALQLQDQNFSVTTPIFETGITSIELIRLKRCIETHLQLSNPIPIIQLMTNPTIRSLVAALQASAVAVTYEPIVVIQPHGTKPPLWLIHPGVGEILVFLNLAKYFTDRPVYAIRARGFNKGESYFTSVADAASTYHLAIKRQQPEGPYAVAGYSYGAMLAFETAKLLERGRDEVRFVGSLNLPPHIKTRMRQLSWTECLLHLAYFLDLISERHARNLAEELHTALREEVLAHVLTSADPARLAELALTPLALVSWANLAYALQSMAVDYEPSGSVAGMEVFYCTPLAVVAASREQWLAEHLSKWKDFVRGEVGFHEVGGEHYTMLGKEHVFGFQKTLRRVLQAKGL